MNQELRNRAQCYLRQKTDQNINLLAALQDGIARVILAEERGCLLCTGGEIWQIAAADAETALRFLDRVPAGTAMLEVQEISQADAVAERFQPRCIEFYHNAWYAGGDIQLPEIGAEARLLTAEDAPVLARYYHLPGADAGKPEETEAYLRSRSGAGTLYGAFLYGNLAGFVGTH